MYCFSLSNEIYCLTHNVSSPELMTLFLLAPCSLLLASRFLPLPSSIYPPLVLSTASARTVQMAPLSLCSQRCSLGSTENNSADEG